MDRLRAVRPAALFFLLHTRGPALNGPRRGEELEGKRRIET